MDSDKCCDYCPTSHTWACLSRHTADERADALRHQAAHGTMDDVQSSSSAPAKPPHEPSAWETVMNVYDFEPAGAEPSRGTPAPQCRLSYHPRRRPDFVYFCILGSITRNVMFPWPVSGGAPACFW